MILLQSYLAWTNPDISKLCPPHRLNCHVRFSHLHKNILRIIIGNKNYRLPSSISTHFYSYSPMNVNPVSHACFPINTRSRKKNKT